MLGQGRQEQQPPIMVSHPGWGTPRAPRVPLGALGGQWADADQSRSRIFSNFSTSAD